MRTAERNLGREVTGGYASDLMSDVLAHGGAGNLWITLQIHQNVVAVAKIVVKVPESTRKSMVTRRTTCKRATPAMTAERVKKALKQKG